MEYYNEKVSVIKTLEKSNSVNVLREELVSFYSFFRLLHSFLASNLSKNIKRENFDQFFIRTRRILDELSNITYRPEL
jgi:hypothetical protein